MPTGVEDFTVSNHVSRAWVWVTALSFVIIGLFSQDHKKFKENLQRVISAQEQNSSINFARKTAKIKAGLHISHKDRKQVFSNMFLSCPCVASSLYNDHKQ